MTLSVFVNNKAFDEAITGFYEEFYLRGIVGELQHTLHNPDFLVRIFIYLNISSAPNLRIEPLESDVKNVDICIIIDEYYKENPELLELFDCVFQAYLKDIISPQNYYHFPLGYSRQLLGRSAPMLLSDRPLNVFFSGNLHIGRKDFYKSLSKVGLLPFFITHRLQHLLKIKYDSLFPKAYIRFTNGFGRGLSREEYSDFLYESKIILCPGGIVNIETYRLYEALKAGCIIVSEELPEKSFYKDIPIIQVKSWKNSRSIIGDLIKLSDERKNKLQQDTIAYWESVLSERAIAKYICSKAVLIKQS